MHQGQFRSASIDSKGKPKNKELYGCYCIYFGKTDKDSKKDCKQYSNS